MGTDSGYDDCYDSGTVPPVHKKSHSMVALLRQVPVPLVHGSQSRLPFLCVLVLSAALQCSHFLQFVRDSPVDEIGYDTYQVPVILVFHSGVRKMVFWCSQ